MTLDFSNTIRLVGKLRNDKLKAVKYVSAMFYVSTCTFLGSIQKTRAVKNFKYVILEIKVLVVLVAVVVVVSNSSSSLIYGTIIIIGHIKESIKKVIV